MTKFFKSGNTYRVAPGDSVDVRDELPAGNYVVKFSPMEGFWLETAEPFKIPSKIYGDCLANCDRILNTFDRRRTNTGVMLVGEKGSGKTLLARQIAISSKMPVIIINTDYCGDGFNSFLSAITQPSIVMFDEFEKVYDREKQEKILTLLDGTFQSEKLFVLTSNDKWKLDSNMKNRPGRIFYLIEFDGLAEDFIRQYCADNLLDQSKTDKIVEVSALFDKFNFDLLSSFVEEVNRYGENPVDLVRVLNAKPEYGGRTPYLASLQIGSHDIPPAAIVNREILTNTTVDNFVLQVYFTWKEDGGEEADRISEVIGSGVCDAEVIADWLDRGLVFPGRSNPNWTGSQTSCDYIRIECAPEEITRYEGMNGIVYKTEEGYSVKLTKYMGKRNNPRRVHHDYD